MISFRVLVFVILTVKGLDCEPLLYYKHFLCGLPLPSTNELSEEYERHWYRRYNKDTSTTTDQITSTAKSSTTPDTNSVKSPRPNGDEPRKTRYNHQSTKKPQNTNQPKPSDDLEVAEKTDQLNDSPSPSDKKIYVIIASATGTIIVTALIYVIVKKYTRKASDSEDPQNELKLKTDTRTNVVYAELDIKPRNAPVSATMEDTTYAEIIGVLRPTTENIKK